MSSTLSIGERLKLKREDSSCLKLNMHPKLMCDVCSKYKEKLDGFSHKKKLKNSV